MLMSARHTGGFTLVELLIAVSLIAIMTGAAIPSFTGYIKNQNARQAQEQLRSDLRSVQTRALIGAGSTGTTKYWGIKITTDNADSYYFFKSDNNDSAACTNAATSDKSSKFPGDIVIHNGPSAGNFWCIFFSYSDGTPNMIKNGNSVAVTSPVSLGLTSDTGNKCSYITLNSVGLVTKSTLNNQACEI